IGEAVLAVPELGGDELLKKRLQSTTGDGNITTVGERNHAESVFEALFGGDIAGNDGDSANIQLGRIEREHESHGIIGDGVGVKNDFFADCGGGQNEKTGYSHAEEKAEQGRWREERFPFD